MALNKVALKASIKVALNTAIGVDDDADALSQAIANAVDAFVKSGMHLIFEKQSYDVVTNPNFDVALRQLAGDGLRKIIVNGFATDYCVRAAAEGMAKIRDAHSLDLQLYVVRDAVEEVNIDFTGNVDMDFGKKALEEMVGVGAKLITTGDVLGGRI